MNKLLMTVIASLLLATAAQADDAAQARTFFEGFAAKVNDYDQGVADLYSEEAKIITLRTDAEGGPHRVSHHALKWKRIMVLAMQLGKIRQDKTDFTITDVIDEGDGTYKIKAERTSHLLCYTDRGYFQRVKRQVDGTFLIVQEYLETQEKSDC
ncbi:hypothetical protein [Aestuariispira insulae]|uniref:SnoaL-like protein n=1 Tax=Aestuariispira insulae TaxID=1461337 RepID=A0A3D9HFE7_9PROT|nr:hypothetical protein [Aestuariispira insulae]RED47686.1 hypothetical protein DFP90_10950 [Aestuariispira insulae]